jgi:Tfp pilus assembly protein PilO
MRAYKKAYKKYLMMMAVVWGAAFVLFVVAYFLVIAPQLKIKAKLVNEASEKQKASAMAVNAAQEENKKKMSEEVEQLKTRLYDYAADFENSANMTLDISRIAADKQVTEFTVKAGGQSKEPGSTEPKNIRENPIEISFVSDFRQFASFLNTLERHRPVVFVDRFKVSRGNEGAASNKVDMDLSIFVRKSPEG